MTSVPGRIFDVVILQDLPDPDGVVVTLDSLAGSGLRIGTTMVSAAGADDSKTAGDHVVWLPNPGEILWNELPGTCADVIVLRAGDALTAQGAKGILEFGNVEPILAFSPTHRYTPRIGVGNRAVTVLGRDSATVTVGSAGFMVRRSILARQAPEVSHDSLAINLTFLGCLLRNWRVRNIAKAVDLGRNLEDSLKGEAELYDREWYFGLEAGFEALIAQAIRESGDIPEFLSHAYVYLLQWRFLNNKNSADKMILRDELSDYFAGVGEVLQKVGVEAVFERNRWNKLDFGTRVFIARLGDPGLTDQRKYFDSDIALVLGDTVRLTAASVTLEIESMNLEGDNLRIEGRYNFPLDPEKSAIVVVGCGDPIPVHHSPRYAETRVFGQVSARAFAFRVSVPIDAVDGLAFRLVVVSHDGRTSVPVGLRFRRTPSRLTDMPSSYWCVDGRIVQHHRGEIVVRPATLRSRVGAEYRYLRDVRGRGTRRALRVILLRALYFLTAWIIGRRKTWIYFDKLYKAGDNGEYAYRYARSQRDGIRKCYIMNVHSVDLQRFKKERIPFVRYESLRARLLFLNASLVFSTHINPQNFGGFADGLEFYFRGLFKYRLVAIQHGLSVQDLAGTLNQVFDNTHTYCLASHVEAENLSRPEYSYRQEQLVMTGLARYDGLVAKESKQILITPTWRGYLAAPYSMGRARGYSPTFKRSEYFALYSSLISDERLLGAAREYGYRVTLLLHPVTSSQAVDFEGNDVVEVLASVGDTSYEQILTESAIMVTDYSGVQFDFAYMKKPLLYFHPPTLPPTYHEGAYEYESMALGPIYKSVDELVEGLTECMQTGTVDEKYRRRAEDFFAHDDRHNAQRIYDVGVAMESA